MDEPTRISVRDLRNHVSEVLRRVEAGETLEVTVNERPVALLIPRRSRARTLPAREFLVTVPRADGALAEQLDAAMSETTTELDDPWQT